MLHPARTESSLLRLRAYELVLCEMLNRASHRDGVRRFFAVVSRLGDGVLWFAIILALPFVYGETALLVCANMITTGIVAILVYKLLKGRTSRPRPFTVHESIRVGAPPLDQYSFPSGHTLHAFSFTVTATAYYPELGWIMVPASGLMAISRLVLGLHYPTDVLAGAALGVCLAQALLYL